MAKLTMSRIEIIASLECGKELVDMLQRRGVMEISKTEIDGLANSDTSTATAQFSRYSSVANEALEALRTFAPQKKPITAMLAERRALSVAEYAEQSNEADAIFGTCHAIVAAQKAIIDDRLEIVRCNTSYDLIKPWLGIDIPTSCSNVGRLSVFIGSLPAVYDAEGVLTELARLEPDISEVDAEIVAADETTTRLVVMCHSYCSEKIEAALRSMGFSRVQDPTKHPPKVRAKRLTDKIEALEKDIEEKTSRIVDFASEREKIEFLIDYFKVKTDKYEALALLGMTSNFMVISGYAAEKNALSLKEYIEKNYTAQVTVIEPDEDEDVPVQLENNSFARPAESIVRMYSMPSKNDIDPTALTAFFYYVFFGAMLSDAGYGLIMAIATGVVLKKFKLEKKMRDTVTMYFWCGVSTLFWGAMYGSWFGDIINVVRTNFLNMPEMRLYIWLDPLNQLMQGMLWCFAFGLVHLFTGCAVKAYMCWRDGDKFGAFAETIPIYTLVLGAAPIFAGMFIEVPEVLNSMAPYALAIGAVLVVLTAGRSSKSIGGKIGGGLYGLYNTVSGYLGDVLSYSRLLALGLATGVIANVVNMMGSIPSNTVVKGIVLTLVFCVGHVVNMAINLIGAYVHTLRLQFVEFYSKFYEGGGRELVPLEINTKFVKFKEEIKNG